MTIEKLRQAVEETGYRFPENAVVREGEFGDSDELARELVDLIVNGDKRATCSQGWLYKELQELLPRPGDFEIVPYPGEKTLVVLRLTEVKIHPFNKVPEEFAIAEGEGDYSAWRDGHVRYFTRECEAYGRIFLEADPVVCVRFDLEHVAF